MKKLMKGLLLLTAFGAFTPPTYASVEVQQEVTLPAQRKTHIPAFNSKSDATLKEINDNLSQYFKGYYASPKIPLTQAELEKVENNHRAFEESLNVTAKHMADLARNYGWADELEAPFGQLIQLLQKGVSVSTFEAMGLRLAKLTPDVLKSYYYNPPNFEERTAICSDGSGATYESVAGQVTGLRAQPTIQMPGSPIVTSDIQLLELWEQDWRTGYSNINQIFLANKKLKESDYASPFTRSLEEAWQQFDQAAIILNKSINYFWQREKLLSYALFTYPIQARPDFVGGALSKWLKIITPYRNLLATTSNMAIASALKIAVLKGWAPMEISSINGLTSCSVSMIRMLAQQPNISAIFEPTSPLPPLTSYEVINAFANWLIPISTSPKLPRYTSNWIGLWADYQIPKSKRGDKTKGIFDLEEQGYVNGLMDMLEKYSHTWEKKFADETRLMDNLFRDYPELNESIETFRKSVLVDPSQAKSETLDIYRSGPRGDGTWWSLEKQLNSLSESSANMVAHDDFYEVQTYFNTQRESQDKSLTLHNIRRLQMISLYSTTQINSFAAFAYLSLVKASYVKPFNEWESRGNETYKSYYERLGRLAPKVYQIALTAFEHRLAAYVILNEARKAEGVNVLSQAVESLTIQ